MDGLRGRARPRGRTQPPRPRVPPWHRRGARAAGWEVVAQALRAALLLASAVLAACGADDGPRGAESEVPSGMVLVGAGRVDVEGVSTRVAPFLLDADEVTNAAFARFVEATGHVTDAERAGRSLVLDPERGARGEDPAVERRGADWRHPAGPGSSIEGQDDRPVVQVSWHDALAYARWRGARLPTLAEWLHAAGAADGRAYPWGDELRPAGPEPMNAWQGTYPLQDTGRDGWIGLAPVGSYPATGPGLFDLAGNVWEWTAEVRAFGGGEDERLAAQVGGAYTCAEEHAPGRREAPGYRLGTLRWGARSEGAHNVGFRCARDVEAR